MYFAKQDSSQSLQLITFENKVSRAFSILVALAIGRKLVVSPFYSPIHFENECACSCGSNCSEGYPVEFGEYQAPLVAVEEISTEPPVEAEAPNIMTKKGKNKKGKKSTNISKKKKKTSTKKAKTKAKKNKKTSSLVSTAPLGSRAAAEQDARGLSKGGANSSNQELEGTEFVIGMDVDAALSRLRELNPSFDFRVNHEFSQYPFVYSPSFARLLHDSSNVLKAIVRM